MQLSPYCWSRFSETYRLLLPGMLSPASIPAEISKEDAIAEGKKAVADKISGNIIKEIYVPKKIINIVVK